MPERPAGGAEETNALKRLAVVTVTYNPDLAVLRRQLDEVPEHCLHVIVDNATKEPVQKELRDLAAGYANVRVESHSKNLGLAAGLNCGIARAAEIRPEIELVLLLDQDTEPGADGVAHLLGGWRRAANLEPQTGCVGPRLRDAATGLEHGFHQIRGWRWTRTFPPADAVDPIPVASVNGSGTLMPVKLWSDLGGFDESLFIDHVDTEWSFRIASRGYRLYGIPTATFIHRMGEATRRLWLFGWRVWPMRTPARHFYLFRNTVRLMRSRYAPATWRSWAVAKLSLTFCVHLLADQQRFRQAGRMLAGLRAGLRTHRPGGSRTGTGP